MGGIGRIFRLLIPKPSFHIVSPDNCVQCGTKLTFERSRARFKTAYMYSFSSGPKILRSYSKSCESCNKSVYSAYFCVKSGNRGRQSSIRHLSPYPPHTPPWPSFTPTILVYNTQIDNTFARPIQKPSGHSTSDVNVWGFLVLGLDLVWVRPLECPIHAGNPRNLVLFLNCLCYSINQATGYNSYHQSYKIQYATR